MRIITTYERPSNRHAWRPLLELPVERKGYAIAYARAWRGRLADKWLPRQLGYIIDDVPDGGRQIVSWSVQCNDPRIILI